MCKGSVINKTALFVSVGVVVSLLLVFIIVTTIRCVYKPLRPRIKKTYVVHKNVTPTPLTCRPTTEQCEITIENCCNMNICDTVSRFTIYFSEFTQRILELSIETHPRSLTNCLRIFYLLLFSAMFRSENTTSGSCKEGRQENVVASRRR